MTRVFAVFVGLALVLASVRALGRKENPEYEGVQYDTRADIPEEITIYFWEDSYREAAGEMPSNYLGSYQLSVPGATYSSSGSSANVTSTGLIKPKGTYYYWKNGVGSPTYRPDYDKITIVYYTGVTTVTVTVNGNSTKVKVNVLSYATVYVEEKVNRIISEEITSGMTPLEKLTAVTYWIANNTDYDGRYYKAQDMLIYDGGDCWASTETIIKFCKKLKIDCRERRGNQDFGAASGHKNAIAYIGDKYYVADAGYSGKKPRNCHVREEPGGFASGCYSIESQTVCLIYQYDGLSSSVTIPSQHDGRNITGLGKNGVPVFIFGTIRSLHIPAFITRIWEGALSGNANLTSVTVDAGNEYYESSDGVLYTKGKKTLLFTPTNKKTLTIEESVTEIGVGAMNDCQFDNLVIPGTVKTVGASALEKSKVGNLTIEEGVETIGNSAFLFMKTVNPRIVLPDSVTTLGRAAFSNCNVTVVKLPKNLKVIPRMCFNVSSVKMVEMPETVETIEKQAFYQCRNLLNITIPVSVTHIESSVFDGYWGTNLKDLYYMGSPRSWKKITFDAPIPDSITVHYAQEDSGSDSYSGIEESISIIENGDAAARIPVLAAFMLFMSVFVWLL